MPLSLSSSRDLCNTSMLHSLGACTCGSRLSESKHPGSKFARMRLQMLFMSALCHLGCRVQRPMHSPSSCTGPLGCTGWKALRRRRMKRHCKKGLRMLLAVISRRQMVRKPTSLLAWSTLWPTPSVCGASSSPSEAQASSPMSCGLSLLCRFFLTTVWFHAIRLILGMPRLPRKDFSKGQTYPPTLYSLFVGQNFEEAHVT